MTGRTTSLILHDWRPPAGIMLGNFSPSRCLTEAFVHHQLPALLNPGAVSVLDVGCGSGRTSALMAEAGYRGHYTGIDMEDRFATEKWADGPFETRFIQGDAHHSLPKEQFDVIMSMSALEHIQNDSQLITRFDGLLSPGGMQIHFLPAPASLFVYLWHGYRQYSVQAIAQRFGESGTEIYRLGGLASLLLHFFVITVPEMFLSLSIRRRWPRWYASMLGLCLRLDSWMPILSVFHVVCRRKAKVESC